MTKQKMMAAARLGTWELMLVAALHLSAGASVAQDPPEELRGVVSTVQGERIAVRLSDSEWLPHAADAVTLGQEISEMMVPLKGSYVIIQVNPDSCVAQPVGKEQHGSAAADMLAIIKTSYPHRPQRRAEFLQKRTRLEARLIPFAEGGDASAQQTVASSLESIGDHDGALRWYERAQTGARERFVICSSALGRAKILATRGQYEQAYQALMDAATRTRPGDAELTFDSWGVPGAVEWHVNVLQTLGAYLQGPLGDKDRSFQVYREAARVMEAVVSHPGPEDPGLAYMNVLQHLISLYELELQDQESAIPWLKVAARRGSAAAQSKLRNLGQSW